MNSGDRSEPEERAFWDFVSVSSCVFSVLSAGYARLRGFGRPSTALGNHEGSDPERAIDGRLIQNLPGGFQ